MTPRPRPNEIARVLRSARERSLPVYIELPRDLVGAETAAVPVLPRRPADSGALTECAEEILAKLARAKSPVIIVDVEVRRYGIEARVADLARKLGVPVVTTFMGRGLLEDAPDVVIGTYLGAAGHPAVTKLVERADMALLLGVIVCDTNFALSQRRLDPRRTVLAIDRQVRIGHHAYAEVPIEDLVEALLARARPLTAAQSAGRRRRSCAIRAECEETMRRLHRPTSRARSMTCSTEHDHMPMTADTGDCLFVAMEIENTALAAPGYYAGMGFGVPAGIGVAAATGRRPMILVGDGAFQMTGWELGNCRRYGLDPIVVLFNNRSWEMLRVFQPESAFNDLDDWHFADIAPLARRTRRARHHAPGARGRARARGRAARRLLAGRGDAAARRDLEHAGALRRRLQGGTGRTDATLISPPCGATLTASARRDRRARARGHRQDARGCARGKPALSAGLRSPVRALPPPRAGSSSARRRR